MYKFLWIFLITATLQNSFASESGIKARIFCSASATSASSAISDLNRELRKSEDSSIRIVSGEGFARSLEIIIVKDVSAPSLVTDKQGLITACVTVTFEEKQ